MNTIEDAISAYLASSSEQEERATLLELLLDETGPRLSKVTVSSSLIFQFHAQLKGTTQEAMMWEALLPRLSDPLPNTIANDLIDRDVAIVMMGHTRQSEAVLRRLAPLVDEALLTFGEEIYCSPQRSTSELTDLFNQYPHHQWLSSHLAYCLASSPEKEAAFLRQVQGQPLEQIALETRSRHERAVRQQQEKADEIAMAKATTDAAEIRALYAGGEFEVLLELTHNPATPLDLLTALSQSRHFTGAPELRREAKKALQRRNPIQPH